MGTEGAANCQAPEGLPPTVAWYISHRNPAPKCQRTPRPERVVRNVTHPLPLGNSPGARTVAQALGGMEGMDLNLTGDGQAEGMEHAS